MKKAPALPKHRCIGVSAAAPILVMLLMASAAIWGLFHLVRALEKNDQHQGAVALLDQIYIRLLDAETGQRGFLVAQEEQFLQPYLSASADLDSDLKQLFQYFHGPQYTEDLDRINTLIREKLLELKLTIDLAREGDWVNSMEGLRSGEGKRIMDELRLTLSNLRDKELTRLAAEEATISTKSWVVAISTSLIALFGIVGALCSAVRTKKETEGRELAYAEIEKTVQERTHELQETLEKLEISDAAKTDFLAVMSHEMRTPLNTVLGYTQLLNEKLSPHHQKEYIEAIRAGGEALLGAVNEVLDFAAIERGEIKTQWEPVNVRQLIDRTIMAMRPPNSKNRLLAEIGEDLPNTVLADRDKLRQIIVNLIANALKFSPDGEVLLKARVDQTRIVIDVIDNGIGIPEDAQATIFDPFIQADSSTRRKFGGTGLGLAISRKFVEAMEGQISVKSEVDQGSQFTFWIPLKKVPAEAVVESGTDYQPQNHFANLNCLVVEDNHINRKLVVAMLAKIGFHARSAANGHECLSLLDQRSFDVIFMDLEMPEMDGYDTTREIRRREEAANIGPVTIFALTGDVVDGVRERCMEAGMNGYLSKPIKIAELCDVFRDVQKLD